MSSVQINSGICPAHEIAVYRGDASIVVAHKERTDTIHTSDFNLSIHSVRILGDRTRLKIPLLGLPS